MVCTPGSTPYFSYEAFAGLKYYTPFYAQDFHPGGLCQWWAPPGSTPYFSYEAFAGLKYYTPFYAQDFHPGGLCKWEVPLLPCSSFFFRRNGRYLISVTADNVIDKKEASIYIAIIDDPKWSAPEVTIYGPYKTSVSWNHKAAIVDQ